MFQQKGMTAIGMLLIAIVVAFMGLITIKVVPTILEYESILKAVRKAGGEATSVIDAQNIYGKAAEIDQIISSVQAKDLDIQPDGNGHYTVSFAYNKEIPLFANAYILIKYSGSSGKGDSGTVNSTP